MPSERLHFEFHGIALSVESNDEETLSFVRSDFSYFHRTAGDTREPDITVRVIVGEPPLDRIPEGTVEAFHTRDAVVYKHGGTQYYDSSGKVLVIYEPVTSTAEIHSLDRDLLFEKSYLVISSRVGELMDRRHLHRIHAMGIAHRGRGVICILPSGGGKTTLTLSLLEKDSFSLLSEEAPLVSTDGRLHPFPIRMGVAADQKLSIPGQYLKPFHRTRYSPKTLIDVRFFDGRITEATDPAFLFVGKRVHSRTPRIRPISKLKAFLALWPACVLGVGIPQLMEYLLRFDLTDVARQTPILWSRLRASIALARRSATYELRLGRDRAANADFVASFLREESRQGKT